MSLKSAKRFGPRYGRKLKEIVSKIEASSRARHKCPFCRKVAVKRLSLGIWRCKKCQKKFTAKAYSL